MTTTQRPSPPRSSAPSAGPARRGPRLALVGVLTGVYLLAAAVMFGVMIPAATTACQGAPLDGRFVWSASDAAGLAASCGHTGLTTYAHMQQLDLVYPALLAATLSVWAFWFGARTRVRRWLVVGAVTTAVAGAVLDYLENAVVWTLVRTGEATSWVFTVGGGASLLKNLTDAAAMTAVVVLAARYAWSRRGERGLALGSAPVEGVAAHEADDQEPSSQGLSRSPS